MDRIAAHGWNLLVGQGLPFDQVAEQVAYFRGAVGEAGGDYDPHRVKVARAMYTAPTAKQARQDAEQPFMWFKMTGDAVGAPPERRGELLPENYQHYRRRFAAETAFDYDDLAEKVILFGDPDQVAQRVERLQKDGVSDLIFFTNYGGIPSHRVKASLELFAREVMPRFQD